MIGYNWNAICIISNMLQESCKSCTTLLF